MADLMKETEDVASKRKAYREMRDLLKSALDIVNEVQFEQRVHCVCVFVLHLLICGFALVLFWCCQQINVWFWAPFFLIFISSLFSSTGSGLPAAFALNILYTLLLCLSNFLI